MLGGPNVPNREESDVREKGEKKSEQGKHGKWVGSAGGKGATWVRFGMTAPDAISQRHQNQWVDQSNKRKRRNQ